MGESISRRDLLEVAGAAAALPFVDLIAGASPGARAADRRSAHLERGAHSVQGHQHAVAVGGPVYNVLDFGAKGDGVADDRVSIQNAINAALPSGMIYVPPGVYRVTAAIQIPSTADNLILVGASSFNTSRYGTHASILQLDSNTNASVIVAADGGTFTLRQLVINGNHPNISNPGPQSDAIVLNGTSASILQTTIEDCYIHDSRGNGITSHRRELYLRRVKIDNCWGDGFVTDASSDVNVQFVNVGGCDGYGFNIQTNYFTAVDCNVFTCKLGGMLLSATAASFFDCVFQLNGGHGVDIAATSPAAITRNLFVGCKFTENSQTTTNTSSNVALSGTGNVDHMWFVACTFYADELAKTNKPEYQFADLRLNAAYTAQPGLVTEFASCKFNGTTGYYGTAIFPTGLAGYAAFTGVIDDQFGLCLDALHKLGVDAAISGSFTMAAAATKQVGGVHCAATSSVFLMPTNAAAATLQAGTSALYISAKGTPPTTMTFSTADGGNAAGTETFDFVIVN